MPGGSSDRSFLRSFLKATRNGIGKYSGLAQSHASLPITTRALTSTLRTTKLHCKMQQNWPSSPIEHMLYLTTSRWVTMTEQEENIRLEETGNKRCLRNQRKYVQK